jgi:hypothetical protein
MLLRPIDVGVFDVAGRGATRKCPLEGIGGVVGCEKNLLGPHMIQPSEQLAIEDARALDLFVDLWRVEHDIECNLIGAGILAAYDRRQIHQSRHDPPLYLRQFHGKYGAGIIDLDHMPNAEAVDRSNWDVRRGIRKCHVAGNTKSALEFSV